MEEVVYTAASVQMHLKETDNWLFYRFEAIGVMNVTDLEDAFQALSAHIETKTTAVCIDVTNINHSVSKMLAVVVSLLYVDKETRRKVALAGDRGIWTDLLDILGVKSEFMFIESSDELIVDI